MFMVKRDKNHMLNGNRKLLTKNVFVQNTPPPFLFLFGKTWLGFSQLPQEMHQRSNF